MSIEDKVLFGLLRLSIHHNSQVLEIATNFIGNMDTKRNIQKARDAFKSVHKNYTKEYEDLIQKLEKELMDDTRTS